MRTMAIVGIMAAMGGVGCASSGVDTEAARRDLASFQQSAGLRMTDDVVIEQLFRKMSADRVEALVAGQQIKLSPDEAVIVAEIYATYGSKKAARDAIRRLRPASDPSVEFVAVPVEMGGLAANGESTARR